MLADKDVYDPPPPLTVEQVLRLHDLLRSSELHPYDRASVARILIALYGRRRHSDLQFVKRIEVDCSDSAGYVTIWTGHHKVGKAAKQKSLLLPILVPAESVDGLPWLLPALKAIESAGMDLSGDMEGPLLRAAASSTSAALRSRGVTSAELSLMLRAFLGLPAKREGGGARLPSSHSLKTTGLSWAAKYGLTPEVRATLGRHTYATASTQAIYSRDLAVEPVRQFASVLRHIACKQFMPDSLRSGYFPFPPGPAALATGSAFAAGSGSIPGPSDVNPVVKVEGDEPPRAAQDMIVINDSSEDEASESTSDPGSDSGCEAEESASKKPRIDECDDNVLLVRHRVSDKVHVLKGQSDKSILEQVLSCGRALTDAYTRIDVPKSGQDRCAVCFRNWPRP